MKDPAKVEFENKRTGEEKTVTVSFDTKILKKHRREKEVEDKIIDLQMKFQSAFFSKFERIKAKKLSDSKKSIPVNLFTSEKIDFSKSTPSNADSIFDNIKTTRDQKSMRFLFKMKNFVSFLKSE